VLWAERKDKLFVTIEVQDVQEPKVKVEDSGHLTFSGSSDGKVYSLDLQLHGAVSGTDAKVAVLPRHVIIVLPKAQAGPHWGKLLAGAGKAPHFVKVDWSKYKDEDEEDQEGACCARHRAAVKSLVHRTRGVGRDFARRFLTGSTPTPFVAQRILWPAWTCPSLRGSRCGFRPAANAQKRQHLGLGQLHTLQ
jgi:hypothetical protein